MSCVDVLLISSGSLVVLGSVFSESMSQSGSAASDHSVLSSSSLVCFQSVPIHSGDSVITGESISERGSVLVGTSDDTSIGKSE